MTTYKLCSEEVTECESIEETNQSDSLTTSELTLPLDSTAEDGDKRRRWSADNGGNNSSQKSPRIERLRRVSLGLYNQTTEVIEAGVNSLKKGISRAGQNVTDRAQNKVPRLLRNKIGGDDELSKNIVTSMDSEESENYEKGMITTEKESTEFG
ncbi:uncharacterized protein [Apostichopus japonicus]|uniref:uncharacterized protein n=1 Tax=Stichopus japonicus TaxID=307972 RepID=UPI003AB36E25